MYVCPEGNPHLIQFSLSCESGQTCIENRCVTGAKGLLLTFGDGWEELTQLFPAGQQGEKQAEQDDRQHECRSAKTHAVKPLRRT